MTDKEKAAQEVQEVTEYEQTALFGDQSEDEASKATIAEIKEILEEVEAIRNSEEYGTNELLFKLEEITVLAERCAAPRSLRIVCKSAADTANAVYTITGDSRFDAIAARLRYIEDEADIADQAALYTGMIERSESSVVFTSNGNGYLLPEELEAYREENPVGAEMYEQESKKEAPAGVHKLNIVLHYDPKLDPSSPEFDYDLWREAMFSVDENGENASYRAIKKLRSRIEDLGRAAIEAQKETEKASFSILEEASRGILQKMAAIAQDNMGTSMQLAQEMLDNFINSDTYKAIKESTAVIKEFLEEHKEELEAARKVAEETEKLHPYLLQEIEEANKANPDMEAITLYDVLDCMEVNGEPITEIDGQPFDNPFIGIIENAKQRMAGIEIAQEVQEVIEDLPALQSVLPKNHTMPNNPLMNALQTGLKHDDGREPTPIINAGAFDLPVIKENSKLRRKEITSYTMVSCEDDSGELQFIGGKMTEYERQVSDAVISLYIETKKQGLQPIFTTDMIFRAMPGGGDKASAQQKGAITKAIEKMRRLKVVYDATAEFQQRGIIDKGKEVLIDDFYLSAAKAEYKVKNGGQIVAAYKLHTEPPILSIARQTKQLITVNAKYLEIKKVKQGAISGELVAMNANRQAMTGYMLRRIAVMKKDLEAAREALRSHNNRRKKDPAIAEMPLAAFRKQSDTILFDTLFKETGTATTDRKQTGLNRNFCFDVLDYLKATGYIKDYKQHIKGRSIAGIKIIH